MTDKGHPCLRPVPALAPASRRSEVHMPIRSGRGLRGLSARLL